MVVSFVALVLFTAVATGLPALWLIDSQSENQAWAQILQGRQASQALLNAQQKELEGLALLTAQRPLLPQLTSEATTEELRSFLETLRTSTALDLLGICHEDGYPLVLVGTRLPPDVCSLPEITGYTLNMQDGDATLWLLASEPIIGPRTRPHIVVVGRALNNRFATELKSQTGLDHVLMLEDALVASSLTPAAARTASRLLSAEDNGDVSRSSFMLDGRPYYAARLALGDSGVVDEVALEVTAIARTRVQLMRTIVLSIVLAVTAGSVLGIFLARRITQPLQALTSAATQLSTGNLDTAVTVDAGVQEVALVGLALERARSDLQQTLAELRQANTWNNHVLQSIVEGIVVLDEQNRITFFSPGAERILNSPADAVSGRDVDEVFRSADTAESFSRVIPQAGQPYKVTLKRADAEEVTVSVTAAQLSLPSIEKAGTVLVFRDISDSERIHHLLGQFLANITHEFRTPLSALAASTELLVEQAAELSPDELHELLNSLHLGILGLQTLIDNLLESASMEAGRFRVYPRASDMGRIVADAVMMLRPLLSKYGHQVHVDLPTQLPPVLVDPRRTTQVMVNLLSNAIKYSPDATHIDIATAVVNGSVRVAVADRGPGVPPGYRPELFRRLVHPGTDSTRAQYGVGLGLSVVKAIVEAQGGQVGVEDHPEGGSVFWFTAPVASSI